MSDFDVNKPVENPKLRDLFSKVQSVGDDRKQYVETMNQIMEEIALNARFLAIVQFDRPVASAGGKTVLEKDTKISVQMIQSQTGEVFIPLFTDWENLRKWEPFKDAKVETLILTFDDIVAFVNEKVNGVVINPFTDSLTLPSAHIQSMRETKELQKTGRTTHVVQEETHVMIGEPKEYPQDMVDAICEYAKTNPLINAIYLRQIVQGQEESFLLIVDHQGEIDDVFPHIGDVAVPKLPRGKLINMVPLSSDFGRQCANNEPFYKR